MTANLQSTVERLSPLWRPRPGILLALLTFTAVVQLAVPVSMIVSREATLERGTTYRFKTQPVDPYDAFRGRYVQLGFVDTAARIPEGVDVKARQWIYVPLEVDDEGFARLGPVAASRPDSDHLRVRTRSVNGTTAKVILPFDRYYMEEHSAPEAERLYRRGGPRPAWVTVAVRRGRAVIEELYVDGMPVTDRLELGVRQPLLGAWISTGGKSELARIELAPDGSALCTFGPLERFRPVEEQAAVVVSKVEYRYDSESTPKRLTLGPFDDGPYQGRSLFAVIELDGNDRFHMSWQDGDPSADPESVISGFLGENRETFERASF